MSWTLLNRQCRGVVVQVALIRSIERTRFKNITIPDHLFDDIVNGDCVLFIGAGASTEGQGTSYWRVLLVDELVKECNYPSTSPKRLPDIAEYYCKTLDAGRKGRLVRLIRDRILRFMTTPVAYFWATICHHIVATIPCFKIIVTTNWDPFMEYSANVIPIVRDKDMAYWNDSLRQVLKMHGCIADPSSMVITRSDYERYLNARLQSPICNKLRDLMSTKTFLFLGYSLSDPSFETIHTEILGKMGEFARTSFAVMPDPTDKDVEHWKGRGVNMIRALAFPFLEELRNKLIDRGGMFYVEREKDAVSAELDEIYAEDAKLDQETNVGAETTVYMDGLTHGLKGLNYGLAHGITRKEIEQELSELNKALERWKKSEDKWWYFEMPYYHGRTRSLEWFLSERKTPLLKFFSAIRMEPCDKDEFERELKDESAE